MQEEGRMKIKAKKKEKLKCRREAGQNKPLGK
jgi:hypothetical protein